MNLRGVPASYVCRCSQVQPQNARIRSDDPFECGIASRAIQRVCTHGLSLF
jgi:hypothetical protein